MSGHVAYVFDLDGVVRDFEVGSLDGAIETALGLPTGSVAATAFRDDLVVPTTTGLRSLEQWYHAICTVLEQVVADPGQVRHEMRGWLAHRVTPIRETVERLMSLRAQGGRTYVFTNGTDDRVANVEAAREFGWRGALPPHRNLTPPHPSHRREDVSCSTKRPLDGEAHPSGLDLRRDRLTPPPQTSLRRREP